MELIYSLEVAPGQQKCEKYYFFLAKESKCSTPHPKHVTIINYIFSSYNSAYFHIKQKHDAKVQRI